MCYSHRRKVRGKKERMSVVSFYWKEANCFTLASPSCRHLFKKCRCLQLLTMNCFLHSFLRNVVSCWAFFPAQSLRKTWGSVVLSDGLLSAISTSSSLTWCSYCNESTRIRSWNRCAWTWEMQRGFLPSFNSRHSSHGSPTPAASVALGSPLIPGTVTELVYWNRLLVKHWGNNIVWFGM